MDKIRRENMSRLLEFFDERLRDVQSPDTKEMSVRAPKKIRLPIEIIGDLKRVQAQRLRRIKNKIRKYILL
jgi:hypothetical protein